MTESIKKSGLLIAIAFSTLPAVAALNVPLTVQEALYSGGSTGVARTNEPFCMGIPLADAAGITSTSVLGLTGASAGQFRMLGVWPDGNYKWVKVCGVIASLTAGGATTVTLSNSGSGNFGGSNLATDNGSTITVGTGAATFTVKKANFNLLDSVAVGGVAVVSSSTAAARGLILTGPSPTAAFPANVTCSGGSSCTTVYSSANDANSTCSIEENGPVMAVVRCTGNHLDANGNVYMQYTAREYFYQGKSSVKVTSVLRNANYDTSATPSPDAGGNTFDTAYKGLQSYELRVSPSITGILSYSIATDTATSAGTLNQTGGSDSAYIYQGQSGLMQFSDCSTACQNTYTTDTGFSVVKNGTATVTGTATQYPQGWADISDSAGKGVEIGVYQMAAYSPKSLEFDGGGSDVRIGIWPRQNSQPIYQAWPAWSIHDLYLNFHASAVASPANEFLKFQHYLVARAAVTYYNSTAVFPYPIVDPAVEDAYYVNAAATASPTIGISSFCLGGATSNCTPDRGIDPASLNQTAMTLFTYRNFAWNQGGPPTQEEFRWSDLQKFLQRGFTGRFLNSSHFYRFEAEKTWPHADGGLSTDSLVNDFTWRSRPLAATANAELDNFGKPKIACGGGSPCGTLANSTTSFVAWPDALHSHWYGMPDYYFMTGDETMHEAMMPMKDYYLNNNTYQAGPAGGVGYTRAVGIELIGAARFAEFLQAVGDPSYVGVRTQAETNYTMFVKPVGCVSGYPVGCTPPPLNNYGSPSDPPGVSRERGVHQNTSGRGQGWCPAGSGPNYIRGQAAFQTSILLEGILTLRRYEGPAWSEYEQSLDLAYGMSQWSLLEDYDDDGTNNWQGTNSLYNGFRFGEPIDFASVCPVSTANGPGLIQVGGNIYDADSAPSSAPQGLWFNFYTQYLVNGTTDWERKFKIALDQVGVHQSGWPSDFGSYQIGTLIAALKSTPSATLQDVAFTVQDNGGGNYTLSFTPPAGSTSLRIKWSPKIIMPSNTLLGFDGLNTNTFAVDPTTHATWFGANNVTEPAPTPGTPQIFSIVTGTTGLTTANFSVKAYTSNAASIGPAASLVMVSGNSQSGTAGQPLASPFTVEVTDASGNPISGATVTFTVTAGGGKLATSSVATNSSGVASTVLTLGTAAGPNTVTAASGTLAGSPITFTATVGAVGAGVAATLASVSGNGQSGTVGQALANPFTVKVSDASGNPVSGTPVTFTVASGAGALTVASVATDSNGLASTVLTLGAVAGPNTVMAASGSLTGSPITFTATGTAATTGPAAKLVLVSGNGQSGTLGQSLASPLTVQVTDANGNPVSGATVTFTVTAGGGTVTAASVTTNSSGLASTILTLGATAGINTVTAISGALTGSPITFTTTGLGGGSGTGSINWTLQTPTALWPGMVAWLKLPYDPISQQTFFYIGPPTGSHGIYSTDMYFYRASTNIFTHIAGTGSTVDACPVDTPGMPGDRHPEMMVTDTKRNVIWIFGGVNVFCGGGHVNTNGTTVSYVDGAQFPTDGTLNGKPFIIGATTYTVASVPDNTHVVLTSNAGVQSGAIYSTPHGSSANPREDMYYLTLTATPTADTFHQIFPATIPAAMSYSGVTYDSDDDVIFMFGSDGGSQTHDNWVYCPTTGTAAPGVLTAKQIAAGCVNPDDWAQINPVGGVQPHGVIFNGLLYDTVTKKVIMTGGMNGALSTCYNETWAYDIPTKTWVQKALSGVVPPNFGGSSCTTGSQVPHPSWAYNTSTNKIFFHQNSDYAGPQPSDWQYDPVADTWTQVSSGTGSTQDTFMAYDVAANKLITYGQTAANLIELWQGSTTSGASGPPASPCDLNGDGSVNLLDVQIAISQALGTTPCGSADLNGNGLCTVVDVQRIVNASITGVCKVGQ